MYYFPLMRGLRSLGSCEEGGGAQRWAACYKQTPRVGAEAVKNAPS